MSRINVVVISGRAISQARNRELGKFSSEYASSVAVCELDPEDMKQLDAAEGDTVRLRTSFGEVVLKATVSKQAPHRGVAFIPYGAWASMLFGAATHTSGMPTLKGLQASIERAPEAKVASVQEITRMKGE